MNVDGVPYRTIWLAKDGWSVKVIDQTRLPHELAVLRLRTLSDAAAAIQEMRVRGAPLIGATAAYGLCLALKQDASDPALEGACRRLRQTRPTAMPPVTTKNEPPISNSQLNMSSSALITARLPAGRT